jgi:hypothetical protein
MPSAWSPKDIETATRAARKEEARLEKARVLQEKREAAKPASHGKLASQPKPAVKSVPDTKSSMAPAASAEPRVQAACETERATPPSIAPVAPTPASTRLQPARMRLAMAVGAGLQSRASAPNPSSGDGDVRSVSPPKSPAAGASAPPPPPRTPPAAPVAPPPLEPRRAQMTPPPRMPLRDLPPRPVSGSLSREVQEAREPARRRRDAFDDPRDAKRVFSKDPFGGLY